MTDVPLQFQPGVAVKKLRAGAGISLSQARGAVIISAEASAPEFSGALYHVDGSDEISFEDVSQFPCYPAVTGLDIDTDGYADFDPERPGSPYRLVAPNDGLYRATANIYGGNLTGFTFADVLAINSHISNSGAGRNCGTNGVLSQSDGGLEMNCSMLVVPLLEGEFVGLGVDVVLASNKTGSISFFSDTTLALERVADIPA